MTFVPFFSSRICFRSAAWARPLEVLPVRHTICVRVCRGGDYLGVRAAAVRHWNDVEVIPPRRVGGRDLHEIHAQAQVHVFDVNGFDVSRSLHQLFGEVQRQNVAQTQSVTGVLRGGVQIRGEVPLGASISEDLSSSRHQPRHVVRPRSVQQHLDEIGHVQEHVRVDLHGVGGAGAEGVQPLQHHHGLDGQVLVAVQEVALEQVSVLFALLQQLILVLLGPVSGPPAQQEEQPHRFARHQALAAPRAADDVPVRPVLRRHRNHQNQEGLLLLTFLWLIYNEVVLVWVFH